MSIKKIKMGYLNKENISQYIGENFEITLDGENIRFTNEVNNPDYSGSYHDGNYIPYMTITMNDKQINSALLFGLGIGVLAEWLVNEKNANVDVVEINKELIDCVSSMNFLSNKINFINADVYNYTTNKLYDAIIFDMWFFPDKNYESEVQILKTNYNNNLNENGYMHFLIMQETIIKI